MSLTSVVTLAGVAVSVLAGALLTAHAVVNGDLAATFVRFVVAIGLGGYYLYLYRLSRGRFLFSSGT